MKISDQSLLTPIYLKRSPDEPLPEDVPAYHLLTGSGLYFCRNHGLFESSVPVQRYPSELAGHEASLRLKQPKIPQVLFERIIGFFSRVAKLHGSEAAVLLVLNRETQEIELLVPPQVAVVSTGSRGKYRFPLTVEYETPILPDGYLLVGDVHSHVNGAAYASHTDVTDEVHRPGLHMVVGRISQEPPELHIEYTVDGYRFKVPDPAMVIEGYGRRREEEVSSEWMDLLTVKLESPWYYSTDPDGEAAAEDSPAEGRHS